MNVELNSIFDSKSREFKTNPIMAARYEPGMENGWSVYYNSPYGDGYRYFNTYEEANAFYEKHPLQKYIDDNGNVRMCDCEYYMPDPVLYVPRYTDDASCIMDASHPLPSDESHLYNVLELAPDTWIIKESDGSIRAWNYDLETSFLGAEYACLYETESKEGKYNADWLKRQVG